MIPLPLPISLWVFHGEDFSGKKTTHWHTAQSYFEDMTLASTVFIVVLMCCRWFSLVRIWTPWLAPRHGKSSFGLDKDAVLCSFLSPTGRHLVVLGISGLSNVMTVFRSNDSGQLMLHVCLMLVLCLSKH
jgi:hypothetical protein